MKNQPHPPTPSPFLKEWRGGAGSLTSLFLAIGLSFASDPSVMQKGKSLYDAKCSQCHGETGDGKGPAAEFLKPLPRDFTSGAYKIRTTESGELPTHQDVKNIIKRGMPYTAMPAWPRFSDQELDALVAYIESFNADFADTAANKAKPVAIPKAPAFSKASAEKGLKVFEENKCADCHGKLGRGDGESAPTLKDDWSQPIRPTDLTKPWTFRGGSRREDIYRTFTTGLNGTPMPSFASSINEEDRWHLVDYITSLARASAPGYATALIAENVVGSVDLARGESLFVAAPPALFPIIGQVIEDPRGFTPGVNAVELRAVYDSNSVAFMLSWHDMSAQKTGSNTPVTRDAISDTVFSDAVALEIPWEASGGVESPYFLFGDPKHPVEISFRDVAASAGALFKGKGSRSLESIPEAFESRAEFSNGEWRVYFKRERRPVKRLALEAGQFIPIAFSVWDGAGRETGSRRGITTWCSLYLKPPGGSSPLIPAAAQAGLWLGMELLAVFFLRRKYRA